ncbi:MAG TPA: fumarylacetoacetate hydrolase family protein [Bryobacteraceae bacterium]|nr:fumarylacetoacetate hydrolase family protein [Bryobacteraceae bacterium]
MDIEQLAKRQLRDYDRHQPGGLFAGYSIPMTVDDAYALQMEVARLRVERGEPVAGYKVGCISPVVQAQLGLDRPVFGLVFGTEIHSSGVVLNPDDYDGLAIEGELAVRIARDIPDADWLRSHPDEAISSGFAVIELHNYVFRNTPHNAQELIGNNAIHAGVVLPPSEAPLSRPSELSDASIQVSRNGVTLGAADGRALPEGPFGSVVRLARHLAGFGRILERGQIVLTGSPLPLYRVAGGERIEVSCNGSGTVVCVVSRPAWR